LRKQSVGNAQTLVSDVRCAAGRLAKKTDGLVTAATNGTLSIREEPVQLVCTNELKPSASRAVGGRGTLCGTWSDGVPNRSGQGWARI
jgi:hypothetical protein